MTFLDYAIFLFLFVFVWTGFWGGFVRTLGSLVGLFIGVAVASHYYEKFAGYFRFFFLAGMSTVSSFFFIVVIISKLTGFVFWIVDKIFKIFYVIPFVKMFNKLLGALLGFAEGALLIGVILLFASKITLFPAFTHAIEVSNLAKPLMFIANVFLPLFPEALKKAQEVLL
ncbi:MAG TPA: CvpA family protein [Patescibacteria group bacterium]|nr:CvpA family protein [Patescibacteria group bacterium]